MFPREHVGWGGHQYAPGTVAHQQHTAHSTQYPVFHRLGVVCSLFPGPVASEDVDNPHHIDAPPRSVYLRACTTNCITNCTSYCTNTRLCFCWACSEQIKRSVVTCLDHGSSLRSFGSHEKVWCTRRTFGNSKHFFDFFWANSLLCPRKRQNCYY